MHERHKSLPSESLHSSRGEGREQINKQTDAVMSGHDEGSEEREIKQGQRGEQWSHLKQGSHGKLL